MLHHDMTNDYREREYKITITLQEGYYKGEIYYEYITGGAAAHGLDLSTIKRIYNDLTNLEYEEDDNWGSPDRERTGGFELHNNCGFVISNDNIHVHFILRDDKGNKLEKTIYKYDLNKYIIGVAMTSCIGRGVKRDSRRCAICSNFQCIEGTASGLCLIKKRKVTKGTVICKYGFVENKKRITIQN